ncbi:MAG TPA: phosphoadenosine phosphosulfate reductase family protein [Syntrophobacteraceae bacterium]|nr:phosphoadenosine phosphosulfate reductase family protein [Syntrophobacteraceae bacterium]
MRNPGQLPAPTGQFANSVRPAGEDEPGDVLDLMVNEALKFIKAHEPPEGYFIAFSGGKDSIVSLELTRMAGVRHQAFYSCSSIEPPEVVQFIREFYPEVTFLYPERSFWELIRKKFPPLKTKRWCCDFLRKYPSRKIPLKHRIMGMRMEESRDRADRPRIERNKREKTIVFKPLFSWKAWSIWDFIQRYRLPYPSLYDEGWERVGCVVCPFICSPTMKHIERNRERWPGIYRAFEHAVTDWFLERKARGANLREQTPEEYITNWYKGQG